MGHYRFSNYEGKWAEKGAVVWYDRKGEERPQEDQPADLAVVESLVPDPEVVAEPVGRRYTAACKARILAEADRCRHGE